MTKPGLPPTRLGVVLATLAALAGCGDQVQKAKPPEKPGAPSLPAGHPEIGRPAGATGADPFVEESGASRPAMASAQPADPERVVLAGEIAIDPAVKLGPKFTVYVLAVNQRQEKAPVLVKRYDTPTFPFRFELREKDSGMGPRTSDRPLFLRAMISDSGDVMGSRNRTTSAEPYAPSTKDIKLTIAP
jgi:hypothetical protein